MRNVFLVVASVSALAFVGCDPNANNNAGPEPSARGGGPPPIEHQSSTRTSTYDHGATPAPSGSAAYQLPGMSQKPLSHAPVTDIESDAAGGLPGQASSSNGGSGAGATGTKGRGTTLHNGLNDLGGKQRPDQEQKKVDFAPGDPTPEQH